MREHPDFAPEAASLAVPRESAPAVTHEITGRVYEALRAWLSKRTMEGNENCGCVICDVHRAIAADIPELLAD